MSFCYFLQAHYLKRIFIKGLNILEVKYVSGVGAESYRFDVNLEIAQVMTAKFNQCNVKDLTTDMFQSVIASGVPGSMSGAVIVPGIGLVPGWIVGAATDATGAAFTYGLTCWW
ncbi:hypothetical protein NIM72_11375 [Pantoea sp. B550]|uniref:hypothetical protein n=1 Tax=unclassified Pantoea TaxID=2630326 RepID=UPI0020A202E8|nr:MULTISPECIES: hypothetical protein [unclassified Pantoea]MCP1206139.1 hypothetical protein [Pantoea sp. B550]MCT2419454.1 hypothetical protein [Pantoea sp. XY16]